MTNNEDMFDDLDRRGARALEVFTEMLTSLSEFLGTSDDAEGKADVDDFIRSLNRLGPANLHSVGQSILRASSEAWKD